MNTRNKLVVINSRGLDDERSSVAWSIANTAAATNMDVTMFLVAAGVDWARKGAAETARPNPIDPPVGEMMASFARNGGRILVCPPCAAVRGYLADSLLENAVLAGSPVMLEQIAHGAAALTF